MFADNHATERVPDDELVSGFRIAQIYVGVAITLPAFLVAAELFSNLGFYRGLSALALTGLALFVITALTMTVGARTRFSTYTIVESVFGRTVSAFINFLLALTLLGWFAVTVSLFANATIGALQSIAGATAPVWIVKAVGGGLMTGLTLYGFKAIDSLSRFVVPLLALVLVGAFVGTLMGRDINVLLTYENPEADIQTVGAAVSILVGAFMVGATVTPDVARFARSPAHGVYASLMGFGIGSQLVLFFSGVLVLATDQKDFVTNLVAIGLGWPALFVVIFATITTNINNLYSVSLSFGQVFPRLKDYQITAICGLAGTGVALAGIENAFIPFLIFLSISIPPIAGIYVVDYLILGHRKHRQLPQQIYWTALIAWVGGSFLALTTSNGWLKLSGAPAIDAIAVSGALYFCLSMLLRGARA